METEAVPVLTSQVEVSSTHRDLLSLQAGHGACHDGGNATRRPTLTVLDPGIVQTSAERAMSFPSILVVVNSSPIRPIAVC